MSVMKSLSLTVEMESHVARTTSYCRSDGHYCKIFPQMEAPVVLLYRMIALPKPGHTY